MTKDFQRQVHLWVKGHVQATAFLVTLFDVLHCVDDLTDKDKPVATATIQASFYKALVTLPRNEFYQQHFALLNGALQTAILNWHAANKMEVTDEANTKEVAYVLRSSYNDLITLCAMIVGGEDWAVTVAYECRLRAAKEGFGEYLVSLRNEHREA